MTALLLTLAALSIWLYQDAGRRQLSSPLAWVVLLWLLGPLAMAIYWTRRPLFAGEYRSGGRVWSFLKAFLLAVTAWALLLFALFSVWLGSFVPGVILFGVLFGLVMLLGGGWLLVACGLLLAAWLLRDRSVELGPTHAALSGQPVPRPGDALLKVIFVAGLIGVFVLTEPSHPQWVETVEWQSVPGRIML